MNLSTAFTPESLSYLPAFIRGPVAADRYHPVSWLLEAFESNLHLAERFVADSQMLFAPEQIALFPGKVRASTLSPRDLVHIQSFASQLQRQDDPVSKFLWHEFTEPERQAVAQCCSSEAPALAPRLLVQALNRIILGPLIDQEDRFAGVVFSKRTRSLHTLNLLTADDLASASSLAGKLNRPEREIDRYLAGRLSLATRVALSNCPSGACPTSLRTTLLAELNRIIGGPLIYEASRFTGITLRGETRDFLRNPHEARRQHLNRLLLEDAYPSEITRKHLFPETRARLNRLLLDDAFPGQLLALPETPALDADDWQCVWLKWLASWISLDLDDEWFAGPADSPVPGDSAKSESALLEHPTETPRCARAVLAIRQAAALYPWRGTARGLTGFLRHLHDWDVEIIEQSWPRGMEIEGSSTIGEDTWLLDELDPDRHFVALLLPSKRNLDRLGLNGLSNLPNRLEVPLAGAKSGMRIETLMSLEGANRDRTAPIPLDADSSLKLMGAINRLHDVLAREIPVHLSCFVALATNLPAPASIHLPEMVIEVDSTIEHFYLN